MTRLLFVLFAATAFLAAPDALGEPSLLPPEKAFRLSVRGLDPARIEVRFTVVDGYYLYRDKIRFSLESRDKQSTPALRAVLLPPGKVKEDAFFGRVETYRGSVQVILGFDPPAPGQTLMLKAESQGCADIGVCYPPTLQSIAIKLPQVGAAPTAAIESKKSYFE